MDVERFDSVVIGAGQAGLSVGYHLGKAGRSFVVVDAHERLGDNWRERYDSLRLFTPATAVRSAMHINWNGSSGSRFRFGAR